MIVGKCSQDFLDELSLIIGSAYDAVQGIQDEVKIVVNAVPFETTRATMAFFGINRQEAELRAFKRVWRVATGEEWVPPEP